MKNEDPSLILVISIEQNSTSNSDFWNNEDISKLILEKTIIFSRIFVDETPEEYTKIKEIYDVDKTPSILIIKSNEKHSEIGKMWKGEFPKVSQFLGYISNNGMLNVVNETKDNKYSKVNIVARDENVTYSNEFKSNEALCVLFNWLSSKFGPAESYVNEKTGKRIPNDGLATLKEAGLFPEAEIFVNKKQLLKEDGFPDKVKSNSFMKKLRFIFSFINPFDADVESESFWEYQPSNNPDIEEVVARNMQRKV